MPFSNTAGFRSVGLENIVLLKHICNHGNCSLEKSPSDLSPKIDTVNSLPPINSSAMTVESYLDASAKAEIKSSLFLLN